MDIAERRLPQDGRIRIQLGGKELDMWFLPPDRDGEKMVIRLLDSAVSLISTNWVFPSSTSRNLRI